MSVSFSDIEDALLYVSSSAMYGGSAILSRDTGEIFYASDFGDSDELPEDIDDERYIEIPHKNELGLGKSLVLEFASEHLPDDTDQVQAFFRRQGAYSRFKELLQVRGLLDEWHRYEDDRQKVALREWCSDNGIEISG